MDHAIRFRWFIRLGLMGYAATAIVTWAVQGPYYTTAYVAKGIEIALITLLVVDFARMDGNPVKVVKGELALISGKLGRRTATGRAGARPSTCGGFHRVPSRPPRRRGTTR